MIDMDWAHDQLTRAGYTNELRGRSSIRSSVELLLKELNQQNHPNDESVRTVIDLFSHLAIGNTIAPADPQGREQSWKPLFLGDVAQNATVRVKTDAYQGAAGRMHNGMTGRMVAVRGGDVIVQYAGATSTAGHRHNPAALEVLS